jgi:hypothetical protein
MKVKLMVSPAVALVLGEWVDENCGSPRIILNVRDASTGQEYIQHAVDIRVHEFPECCWAEPTAEVGERLYAAYQRGGSADRAGLSWDGRPCPTWAELMAAAEAGQVGPAGVVAKWRATARAASLLGDRDYMRDGALPAAEGA